MTKLYSEVPQLNLQCLHVDDKMCIVYLDQFCNTCIHFHFCIQMAYNKFNERRNKREAWKQEEAKEKEKKPIKINLQNNKKSFKNELTNENIALL